MRRSKESFYFDFQKKIWWLFVAYFTFIHKQIVDIDLCVLSKFNNPRFETS